MDGLYKPRFSLALALYIAFGGVIVGRMFWLPNMDSAETIIVENEGLYYEEVVVPPRGQIYDRWGYLLAGNQTVYELGLELMQIDCQRDAEFIVETLAQFFKIDKNQILEGACQPYEEGKSVRYTVQNYVDANLVLRVENYINDYNETLTAEEMANGAPSLDGINFRKYTFRSYPEGELASNVLGFVSYIDDKAYWGLEEYYDTALSGNAEKIRIDYDPYLAGENQLPEPGVDLILTIDRNMQAATERLLDEAIQSTGAVNGVVVVMDPNNGDILALATSPRWDLNAFQQESGWFPAFAVARPYEVGSVFKVLTMAAALDAGAVTPDTMVKDEKILYYGNIPITNWSYNIPTDLNMTECLQYSSNICLTQVADKLGPSQFYDYIEAFGIGQPTGVDMAGEVSGSLRDPRDKDWTLSDLATNSFGQGMYITVVQMLKAVSALANEGQMVTPHVVKAMVKDGEQTPIQLISPGQPIKAETAATITEMLAISLTAEGHNLQVPGFRVAGKTGTGQIADVDGYTLDVTNASFVGWGPVDDPQFLIYVWLERPESSIWGSQTAGPLFVRVAEEVVTLMGLPPDEVRFGLE